MLDGVAGDPAEGVGGGGDGSGGTPAPTPTPDAGTPPGDAPWYAQGVTSDEHKTWLQNKGYGSLEDTIAAHRSLESKLGAGRFSVPSDWTNAEQATAAYKALGLPDQVGDNYKFELPEGADPALSTGFAEAAHATGVLPHQAQALFQWYTGLEAAQGEAAATAQREAATADIAALKSGAGWGADFEANDAIAGQAAKAFGLEQKMPALAAALGAKGALQFLYDLGKKIGEDKLEGGEARELRGNMTAQAAAEAKKTFMADTDKTAKLRAKDPAATAEWARINAALAAEMDRADAA
jgi:hypothetical protein